jgi:hypothetical protein
MTLGSRAWCCGASSTYARTGRSWITLSTTPRPRVRGWPIYIYIYGERPARSPCNPQAGEAHGSVHLCARPDSPRRQKVGGTGGVYLCNCVVNIYIYIHTHTLYIYVCTYISDRARSSPPRRQAVGGPGGVYLRPVAAPRRRRRRPLRLPQARAHAPARTRGCACAFVGSMLLRRRRRGPLCIPKTHVRVVYGK